MKTCRDCKELKNEDDFSHRNDRPNLLNSFCKSCMSRRMKEWRHKNRERYNKYQYNRLQRIKNKV